MPPALDVVCLSHLRWDFVYQRPQHLMARFARRGRIFFIEEPFYGAASPTLEISARPERVQVVQPRLPDGLSVAEVEAALAALLGDLVEQQEIVEPLAWYYTPMAMAFTTALKPAVTVYDCMDELAAFRGAPPELHQREAALFRQADLVFTGGQSLFEAKRNQHRSVHAFPSSVDTAHFAQARTHRAEPADQAAIPGPRLGFFGVIDERFDTALLDGAAALRPDWQFVVIGPVVKIDPAELPQRPNIHYLGGKSYAELPAYVAGWNVALMPFARNDSTRYISPTKTPEYLAAGKPVVSTSITDVIHPYQERDLVRIADTPAEFIAASEAAMAEDAEARIKRADAFLAQTSWDRTWEQMNSLIGKAAGARQAAYSRPLAPPRRLGAGVGGAALATAPSSRAGVASAGRGIA